MSDDTDDTKPAAQGRPRIYSEPRQRLTLELPQALVMQLDVASLRLASTRTAWIEAAIREKLARDGE